MEGETALSRMVKVTSEMFRNEGAKAFYKGITPRVLRVAPGQAIVFTVSVTWTEATPNINLRYRCMSA